MMKLIQLLFVAFGLVAFTGNTGTEEGLKDGEALIVVIDHNGAENYSKVRISESLPVSLMEQDKQNLILQKLAVATVKDQLDRLSPGLYTVIASSNEFLYNKMVFVKG